jgi:hypothetical protein
MEARLVSTAQYENARIEVGCTVSIDATEDTTKALEQAKAFVRGALIERLTEMEQTVKKRAYAELADGTIRKYRL